MQGKQVALPLQYLSGEHSVDELASWLDKKLRFPMLDPKDKFNFIKNDNSKLFVWQPILQKYSPTILGEAQKVIDWSETIVRERLSQRMFKGTRDKAKKKLVIDKIIKELGDHSVNLSHSRHLSIEKCKDIGLKVSALEDSQDLQDKVLSVHHAMMHTLSATASMKIVENQDGKAYILQAPMPTQQ